LWSIGTLYSTSFEASKNIASQDEWAQIPEHIYVDLVASMPQRVEVCIAKMDSQRNTQ